MVKNVLAKLAADDWSAAVIAAQAAVAADSKDELAASLAKYLKRQLNDAVYDAPDGFEAFINNGSNPELYRSTIARLRDIHERRRPRSVVDIGAGDGRVSASVVNPAVESILLVEPSTDLSQQALARPDWPRTPMLFEGTAEEFINDPAASSGFDLVQSTFALHAVEPAKRSDVIAHLHRQAQTVVVVDFDVPDFADRSIEHAAYAAERYQRGVKEYRDNPSAIDNFLMPVLVGQFAASAPRVTFEQSVERWKRTFEDQGFVVATEQLCDYWWAPAFVLVAEPR